MSIIDKPLIVKPPLDVEIDRVLEILKTTPPSSDDYDKITDQLTKLHSLKAINAPQRVSPDVALTVFANLAGILMVIGTERIHVITTKAIGLLMRAR